jgi:flavin-dependent dehydrogenase
VRYVPALEALVAEPPAARGAFEHHALFDFGALPRGYGWVFPKRDHWNVGVYSPLGGAQLRRHLTDFLRQVGVTAAPAEVKFLGFPIPVRNARRRFQAGRVWLLGDAAGLAEGVFGEGIYFALHSAALAAQALAEGGLAPANRRYSELIEHTLLPELRAARWLGRALFAAPGYAFSHLVRNERVNDLFAGTISGAVGYRECLWKTVASAPHWLRQHRAPAE